MNRIPFLLLLLVSLGAQATVTTFSGPCDSTTKGLKGHALLFQNEGKLYAIGSSARVFDGAGSCHQVDGQAANLLAAESGKGLALFGVNRVPKGSEPALADIAGTEVTAAEPVSFVSAKASVLISSTTRHSLALVDHAFEVQGEAVDANALGAPVFLASGSLAGFLSPQYLKMSPGSRTRAWDWEEEEPQTESHLVVVAARDAHAWLTSYFASPSSFVSFFHANSHSLRSGPLRFEKLCPEVGDHGPGDAPIGGGDGVGIGGHEPTAPYCRARLERDPLPSTEWPFPASLAWVVQMRKALEAGKQFELRFFVTRSPSDRTLSRAAFWSVSDLAMRFKSAALIPVVFRTGAEGITDPKQKELAAKALEALPLTVKLYASLSDSELHGLMSRFYLLLEMAGSEQWGMLKTEDLDPLIDIKGSYARTWEHILLFSPESSRPLLKHLQAIRRLLEK